MACTRGVILESIAANVHRHRDLLCTLVSYILGPESIIFAISHALKLRHQRRGARHCLGPGPFEFVDRVSRRHSPPGRISDERRETEI